MAIYAYLFDSEGQDRPVKLDASVVSEVGNLQLLWVDLKGNSPDEFSRVSELFDFPQSLWSTMNSSAGKAQRPRLDLYSTCFHVNVDAIQERGDSGAGPESVVAHPVKHDSGESGHWHGISSNSAFKRITVNAVVFPNVVVTIHDLQATFLDNFDERIKGDTHLGRLDGPAFLGVLLNWHITGYFRALEILEAEVDRLDDAALRLRDDRNLLTDLVRLRRRVALVRHTLLPHREVYATLARPSFAPFVTDDATKTLGLVYDRMERAVEATENARELVLGSFDIFTTQTALRTNEVVKVLTVVSALLLPAGVIATLATLLIRAPVYDLGRTGFWAIGAFVVLLGTSGILVARTRRWI